MQQPEAGPAAGHLFLADKRSTVQVLLGSAWAPPTTSGVSADAPPDEDAAAGLGVDSFLGVV